MSFHRQTTHYPGYNHTSFNLRFGGGHPHRWTIEASLHVRYRWNKGGVWFGLRPEFDVHRRDDLLEATFKQMLIARKECSCARCHRRELGEPGLRLPETWHYVGMREFCDVCCSQLTYKELTA